MASDNNILILKGSSRYNVLRRAADELAAGFEALGAHVTVIDTTVPGFDLTGIIECDYRFCLIPQAFLFDLRLKSGVTLPTVTSYPWVGWIFDDILYHTGRVLANSYGNTALFSVDGAAGRIARDMGLTCNPIGTLLHGGFESRLTDPLKDIDILLPCTLGSAPVWRGASGADSGAPDPEDVTYRLASDAIELWKTQPELSARSALAKVCEGYGESMKGNLLLNLSRAVLFVNDTIRYLCRKKILDSLTCSGLRIDLVGELQSGETYPSNVTVHGPMDIDDTVDLIARSKIMINPFPTVYELGAHERIFTAMLNRTACYTPGYPFLRTLLGDRVRYMDLNELTRSVEDMSSFLSDPAAHADELQDIAEYARTNHTWSHRAREIMDMMQ